MDPIYLKLGLQQPHNPGGSSAVSVVSVASPTFSHINGIPQESKLATYISNRQLPTQRSINHPPSQNQLQMHPSNHLALGQVNLPVSSITKNLAALGLESAANRKPSLSNLGDLGGISVGNIGNASTSLSHSSSTPSFQSFGAAPPASLTTNSSSLAFSPLAHPTTSASTPVRAHSPEAQPSPVRGVSAPPAGHKNGANANQSDSAAALSTYQENVGGTTYFYTAQDLDFAASDNNPSTVNSIVYPPYHVLPPLPANVHHLMTATESPNFFVGDILRNEMIGKQLAALAHNSEQFADLPQEVDMYHELNLLEPPNSVHKSSMFGYATSVYKATHIKTGLHYCLYRIHGYRLSNVKVTQIVDLWKNVQHSSVIQLREVFTTKDFGDNSIVLVYDYYPCSETLASKHFSQSANGWERLIGSGGVSSSGNSFTSNGNNSEASKRGSGMLHENLLWNYIIQLTGAVRAIHAQGLASRTLDASKILLVDNKSRIRINCCGIIDILNFDSNASNPLAGIQTYQQEDLVNLGKLIVSLACCTYQALLRDNISLAIDLINRHYSRDLATLVVCLLTSQRVKSINDVMPIIGARFYTALENSTQRGDIYETELGKELQNGRLFRLITKLNAIVDRPLLNQDTCWSETADRYMLKLLRDYLFYQQNDAGQPWLDLGHITTVLNKLDAGSPDKVCLMSQNEQNVIVASYTELKRCFIRSFQEILDAMAPRNGEL